MKPVTGALDRAKLHDLMGGKTMFDLITTALRQHNARLTQGTAYVTLDDGGSYQCCALGAIALAYTEQPRTLLNKGREGILSIVAARTGWSDEQLLAVESGFEGSARVPVNAELRQRHNRYFQFGQRLAALAI